MKKAEAVIGNKSIKVYRKSNCPLNRLPPLVLLSSSRRAIENLALEETLLRRLPNGGERVLLLYENNPAVIVGRFQNPWMECSTGRAGQAGIPILRRFSGGGTVVHAPGNLNWCFIAPEAVSEKHETCQRMVKALESLGIFSTVNNKNDLLLEFDGSYRKISGSAYRQIAGGALHHGTLLVKADLELIRQLLNGPARRIIGKGVRSVPSPIANLSGYIPSLGTAETADAIVREWGGELRPIAPEKYQDDPVYMEALNRLGSEEWIWGKTPVFSEQLNLPGGTVMECEVQQGCIRHACLNGIPQPLLSGCRYRKEDILAALAAADLPWLADFADLVDGRTKK
ncbi:MAG: hypothetical protein B0D92_02535 [Spirochaeta sp. LUC14_002_19_P3]|nr:MAG: hypothetical protein B0D92_02535 [Spirochaeta sp. LUC14_002_19_P3]